MTTRALKRHIPVQANPALRPIAWHEKNWPVVLLLAVVTVGVFGSVLGAEFSSWDDNLNVSKNPYLNPPSFESVAYFWRTPYLDLYIPVTYTVWGILAAAARLPSPDSNGIQLNPYIFHGANLLFHVLAVLTAYALLRRLVGQRWPAAAGALLFAIHPLQVEPVAWVTGMKDVLCGLLSLAALWQYVLYADERPIDGIIFGRRRHYLLSVLFFVLAVLTKPSAVTVPAAALILDVGILRRTWSKAISAAGPMLLLSAVAILVSMRIQTVLSPADGGNRLLRPLIAADSLAFYLCKLVFPWKLGMHYDHAPMAVIRSGWLRFTWIAPAVLAIVVLAFRKKTTWLAPSAALFAVAVAPVLGLVPFVYQRYSTVADRYVYMAMLGPALAVAAALREFNHRRMEERRNTSVASFGADSKRKINSASASAAAGPSRAAIAYVTNVTVGIVIVILAIRSFMQTLVWHDNVTLFTNALAVNPRSYLALDGLAIELYTERHPDDSPIAMKIRLLQARDLAVRAAEIAPDNPEERVTLGTIYHMLGDVTGATAAFEKAVQVAPEKPEALDALGGVLAEQRRFSEAEALFRRAIKLKPQLAQAHLNLGVLRQQMHGAGDAEAFNETAMAVRLDGGDPRGHTNLAMLLNAHGRHEDAVAQVKIAIQIDPNSPQVRIAYRAITGSNP